MEIAHSFSVYSAYIVSGTKKTAKQSRSNFPTDNP